VYQDEIYDLLARSPDKTENGGYSKLKLRKDGRRKVFYLHNLTHCAVENVSEFKQLVKLSHNLRKTFYTGECVVCATMMRSA
jgi:hypothetical protein